MKLVVVPRGLAFAVALGSALVRTDATAAPTGYCLATLAGTGEDTQLSPYMLAWGGGSWLFATEGLRTSQLRAVQLTTGLVRRIAGTGATGFAGDGGPATAALLDTPAGLVFDTNGDLYVADSGNARIRRIDAGTAVITTVAGTGTVGYAGDGGLATAADLASPFGVAFDASGNLFISDQDALVVRRVDRVTGVITTVAGDGTFGTGGDGGPATSAQLGWPTDLAVEGTTVFIADTWYDRVRAMDLATGLISTVAGGGFGGDGGQATDAQLSYPVGLELDGAGGLLIANQGTSVIRRVDLGSGVINLIAGNYSPGYTGDGGPATAAGLAGPPSAVTDGSGNLYIADLYNGRVRRVDPGGTITTLNVTSLGDGGPATAATFSEPGGVAADGLGRILVADAYNHRVRRIDRATGLITTVAGSGLPGFAGDGGPATAALLNRPEDVAVDGGNHVFTADADSDAVRRVDAGTGIITTVAGNGTPGFSGDGGPATAARLSQPLGIWATAAGDVYIADSDNNVVRKVTAATGVISRVAGTGVPGYAGDGGQATAARLFIPTDAAVDAAGNVYIADEGNAVVRRVDGATGIISTLAGTGSTGYTGDGGPASTALLTAPISLVVGPGNLLHIADTGRHVVRTVDLATGMITTSAGAGAAGFTGDGGSATAGRFNGPFGIGVDASGTLYVADALNHRIRMAPPCGGAPPPAAPPVPPVPPSPPEPAHRRFDEAIVAYPNPLTAGGVLTVALRLEGDAAEVTAALYDLGMRRVLTGVARDVTADDGQVEIADTLGLPPGVYLLRVTADIRGGGEQTFPVLRVAVKR